MDSPDGWINPLKIRHSPKNRMNDEGIKLTLIRHFRETVALSDTDAASVLPRLEVSRLSRREHLLRPGQVSRHMQFIASGSMRCYRMDDKGQEHTLQLGIENWWINDLYSFLTGEPSQLHVQAIEPCTLVQLNRDDLEQLYRLIPAVSDFFRLKFQQAYIHLQKRTMDAMSNDAHSRYRAFIREYRDIGQRVPQYMIASYLGITPEFLSHLRKKHASDIS